MQMGGGVEPDEIRAFEAELEAAGEDAVRRQLAAGRYHPLRHSLVKTWLNEKERVAVVSHRRSLERLLFVTALSTGVAALAVVFGLIRTLVAG